MPLKEVTLHIVEWTGAEPAILGIHGSAQMAHSFGAWPSAWRRRIASWASTYVVMASVTSLPRGTTSTGTSRTSLSS